jgi:hypothetical protein
MGGEAASVARGAGGVTSAAAGEVAVRRARTPSGSGPDDRPSPAPALDPCTLVRRSELQAVTHAAVASASVAPLGPTCIYQLSGSRAEITVAVQSGRLSTVAGSLSRSKHVTVARHHAVCATLGTPRLVVSLSAGRILQVTAPCSVALPVARAALTRLASGA